MRAFPGIGEGSGTSGAIPAALLEAVVDVAVEQERLEGWIMTQVNAGLPLPGLYPPNAETPARYDAWAKAQA